MTRRCLICAKLNPCADHTEEQQADELRRNDAAIARIRAESPQPASPATGIKGCGPDCPLTPEEHAAIDEIAAGEMRHTPLSESPATGGGVELEREINAIVRDALNSAIPEPWDVARHATQRILAALSRNEGAAEVAVCPDCGAPVDECCKSTFAAAPASPADAGGGELEEALEPFIRFHRALEEQYPGYGDHVAILAIYSASVTHGDFRKLEAALASRPAVEGKLVEALTDYQLHDAIETACLFTGDRLCPLVINVEKFRAALKAHGGEE